MNTFIGLRIDPESLPATFKFGGRMSDEVFQDFCFGNEVVRIERTSTGEISLSLPGGLEVGSASAAITCQLVEWKHKQKRGCALGASVGYFLTDGSMLSPTASFISEEKSKLLREKCRNNIPHICPDFVVELVPDSASLSVFQDRVAQWLRNGAELGWLIDPYQQRVSSYGPGRTPIVYDGSEVIYGSGIMEGFEFDTELVWEMYR